MVRTWSSNFVSSAAKIDRTSVWVRITDLNVVFNGESFHLSVASTLGTPIKIDMNSLNVVRGRFTRICIEISLNQPVVDRVWIRDHWYKVEYEVLHIICEEYGCYGHHGRDCLSTTTGQETSPEPDRVSAALQATNCGIHGDRSAGGCFLEEARVYSSSCGHLILLSSMRLWRAGAWNRSSNDVLRGLEAVRKESIKLNRIAFGNIYRMKRKSSEGRINGVQRCMDTGPSDALFRQERQLSKEYNVRLCTLFSSNEPIASHDIRLMNLPKLGTEDEAA
ncbi:hypothetical protein NC651_038503 [Populus alba x Populus x berolinensis]|nr:hypothetical protein NC651_038503 [Populus alba x Populus x berolinensis]